MLPTSERSKDFEIGQGEFHCPNCRCKTRYRRFERALYSKVMFVLTIKGETLETFIICEKCGRRMKDEDLRGNLPKDTRALLAALKEKLKSGQSVQDAAKILIDAGMGEDEARRLVNAAAGIVLRRCAPCGQTYVDTVASCSRCGSALAG